MTDAEVKDKEKDQNAAEKNRKLTTRRGSKRQSTTRRQSRRQSRKQSREKSGSRTSLHDHSSKKSSKKNTGTSLASAEEVEKSLRDPNKFLESPIDLHRDEMIIADIPKLEWTNYQSNPLYLKITNTTNTVVLNGLYPKMYVPTLTGGPLQVPFKFSQFHFHWGDKNEIGSEHKVEGEAYPLEGHMVLYKSEYEKLETARSHEDGVIILVFMFQSSESSDLRGFTKYLPQLKEPHSQIPITTVSLESFFPQLVDDYVLYFGNMSGSCNHGVLWLVSRKTLAVTPGELEDFRKINAKPGLPIGQNFRDVKPLLDRNVYLANVSERDKKLVLHPLPRVVKVGGKSGKSSRKSKSGRRQSKKSIKMQKADNQKKSPKKK